MRATRDLAVAGRRNLRDPRRRAPTRSHSAASRIAFAAPAVNREVTVYQPPDAPPPPLLPPPNPPNPPPPPPPPPNPPKPPPNPPPPPPPPPNGPMPLFHPL